MSKIPKSFVSMIMTALLLASLTAVASADHIPGHLVKTVDYNCDAAVKLFGVPVQQRNFDIQATIEAYDVPSSVNPGQQVTVHNSFATVKVPGDEVLALYNILGWDYISGDVTKFEVKSDNIEQVIDVAPQVIERTKVPTDGSDFEFRVPASGGLEVGPFTAGTSGEINISTGEMNAKFKNADVNDYFSLEANCEPIGDSTLTTVTIN